MTLKNLFISKPLLYSTHNFRETFQVSILMCVPHKSYLLSPLIINDGLEGALISVMLCHRMTADWEKTGKLI